MVVAMILVLSSFPGVLEASSSAVSISAEKVFSLAGHDITDTILTGWIVSLLIILTIRYVLRDGIKLVPSNGQAILECLISGLQSLIEPIVGKKIFKYVFPMLIGYFIFILIHNWSGLFPGVGSVALMDNGTPKYLLRPANSDLNTTLALALVSLFAWAYFTIRYSGIHAVYYEVFGNKADKKEIPGLIYTFLFFVFFAVGFIECLSILFRVVSLSFRLYGNVFGGENLLHYMTAFGESLQQYSIVRYVAYLLPLPFYFLELLVGLIQASVFTLLISVYIGLISNHGNEHEQITEKTI